MRVLTSGDAAQQGFCELLSLLFVVQAFIFYGSVGTFGEKVQLALTMIGVLTLQSGSKRQKRPIILPSI